MVFKEKSLAIFKITISGIGLISTFYTIIDLMLFLSYPYQKVSIDGTHEASWSWNLLVNMFLLSLFISSHSLLALPQVKAAFQKLSFQDLQRSVYIIVTCIALQILIKNWQFVDITLWTFNTQTNLRWWLYALIHIISWAIIYVGNICMDVNELLGLKQVYYSIRSLPSPIMCKSLELQRLYTHMRHPSFIGFLVIFWAAPIMSLDRFLFALVSTLYMFLAWKTDETDYKYQKLQYKKKFNQGTMFQ